jgi:hypothetical protein
MNKNEVIKFRLQVRFSAARDIVRPVAEEPLWGPGGILPRGGVGTLRSAGAATARTIATQTCGPPHAEGSH